MNQGCDPGNVGEDLGLQSMEHVVRNVEAYCAHEERRITLKNQADILAMRAEFSQLLRQEEALTERLERAPGAHERVIRKRRAAYYWVVTAILAFAGFVFSILSFDPYRLGWKSYLYCLGIAVVTPFLVEKIIEQRKTKRFVKVMAIVACAAALASLGLLAVIRGDLLQEQFKTSESPIVVDDAEEAPAPQNNFYDTTLPLLRVAMLLLALGMESGAGLALHDAWQASADTSEDRHRLERELRDVRGRMTEVVYQTTVLQNEPAVFAARFWRGFYRAVLTHVTRSAVTKLVLALTIMLPFAHCRAAAAEPVTLIMAVDLTKSVAGKGPDEQTDFQKNLDAVTKTLAQVPSGCRVVVIGITDRSFTQPYILLSASVGDDAGYFGERLARARSELVRMWKKRMSRVAPAYVSTDVFGGILLAAQLFDQSSPKARKILLIFSDMRHHTADVDLESPRLVPFVELRQKAPLPRLQGVEVYVLGVDGAGKEIPYWTSLERFWTEYFEKCGAALRRYSALRDFTAVTK